MRHAGALIVVSIPVGFSGSLQPQHAEQHPQTHECEVSIPVGFSRLVATPLIKVRVTYCINEVSIPVGFSGSLQPSSDKVESNLLLEVKFQSLSGFLARCDSRTPYAVSSSGHA